ncbi:bifunctional 4-hydroxy-2-oxoglutarate aldolase/2-dehydro-3-deoxy-phosphogluconate aldolase [Kordiimonas sp. SCSIO 12610]|uniref:bifunctional 4-hydroxy-2-oxoglutarate aldolase/2-dehydro-3-deoxy-phosphogluconate aldolase n=1 Tax=Kordiimonas sp. SCSIO 12610 TaxID=2829597 RepID=UPI00210D8A7A|nr:bifunctional 4-hydroxy-2-oxoglutarate aldolase/2-dehydro-3-deoxy-phosphogluconate aldolase [Kordiimonas sp. SCSIO 12610]UTW55841.1 bifunctional 4-hydroxy-2-oxoglutarate aldolase/2-dehydro-3-deoxy-phosphogluconate aldolase [Kordiimonas sp. SCSIO 12610]
MTNSNIRTMLTGTKAIPVLAFRSTEEAVDICGHLIEEGLHVLELTMRHPSALEALGAVKTEFGDRATFGMGTITKAEQVDDVIDAGADFGVSPGLTAALADKIQDTGLPFLPGISTISEAMNARELGFDTLKFFPAEQSGGAPFLKSLGAVLPELVFCPTGGLSAGNAMDYLNLDNVMCFGASAFTKRNSQGIIEAATIKRTAEEFRANGLL